jgi:hypothetical protein
LALQLVHEAALCTNGLRQGRCLTLRGFETLNGLPFLAADTAVHELLGARTVAEAQALQVALGKLRRASGDYAGKLLLIDPHRPPSYSQRHMRKRHQERGSRPIKTAQTFFCLDGDSAQPVCFTSANSARTVSQATPELLRMAVEILTPMPNRPSDQERWRRIFPESFTRHWAGYATAVLPYTPHHSRGGPYYA